MKTFAYAAVFGLSLLSSAALAADPEGTWLSEDGGTKVHISDCGGKLCGTVVWLQKPTDPKTGKPKTDALNVFRSRVRAMGIRDRPISPRSPWQNGHMERLIDTVRCECLDRMLIFGEPHLRRVLASYAAYYNQARRHLALQKDAPLHRSVQRSGAIEAIPVLARLHHQYIRI